MEAVRDWLRRAARRADRSPGLEEALLGGRFRRYAAHRLRFFAGRTAISAGLHAVRILLAFRLFPPSDFGLVLAAEAAAALISSFWWGALEPMRESVRESFAAGKPRRAEARIESGLTRSARWALPIGAAGAAWPVLRLLTAGAVGPSDIFLLAILGRLAVDIVLRGYHSGVFAVRRVYRPFWSLAGLEGLAFGGGLALWPLVGAWALPAASLLSAATSAALSLTFTARAYRHLGIRPRLALSSRPPSRRRSDASKREGWTSGGAYALMRTDGVFLLALLAGGRRGFSPMTALVLAASPLIRAGFDWTQLFYFDLKRLDRPLLRSLGDSFERRLSLASIPIGLAAWAGALALARIFLGRVPADMALAAAGFFLVRSLASAFEMRAYARRAYGHLFGAGSLILAGATASGFLARDAVAAVLTAGAGFLAAAVLLMGSLRGHSAARGAALKTALNLPDWALSLRRVEGPVAVGRACFGPGTPHRGLDDPDGWLAEDRWAHRRIAEAAARRIGRAGEAACGGRGRVLWFVSPPSLAPGRDWLLAEGMGLMESVDFAGPFNNGAAAAVWLAESGWLGSKAGLSRPRNPSDLVEAAGRFRAAFPGGCVLGPGRSAEAEWKRLPRQARRDIWRDALAFVESEKPGFARAYDVSAALEGGSIRLVFAAPAGADPASRRGWRAFIRRRNTETLLGRSPALPR